MNMYRLFTEDGAQHWVRTSSSCRAIRLIEAITKQHVSCWFIGDVPPSCAEIRIA